jgi:hypothetical protein
MRQLSAAGVGGGVRPILAKEKLKNKKVKVEISR